MTCMYPPPHMTCMLLQKVTVSARSSEKLEIEVPAGGFTAKWEVLVEDYGVGMSAMLLPEGGGDPIPVMDMEKIKSESGLAAGSFALPKKGTLVVTFDNSYSLLRSKTFNYKIDVSDDKSAITSGVTARLGGLSL